MIPNVKQARDFIRFEGGLDVVTPNSMLKSGFVIESMNVEQDVNGGYQSIKGFTPFDGSPSPWDADLSLLPFVLSGTVTPGFTITGATSGATATVVAVRSDCFVVVNVTGTWVSETTTFFSATINPSITPIYPSNKDWAEYLGTWASGKSLTVPTGAGNILGIWHYNNIVYAFRNNSGAGVSLFKSSASGWQAVSLGYEVPFTNANASVQEGDTLTQGGVTSTINRVVVEYGTLSSGTNSGRLIISAPSGGNYAAGGATSTGGGVLILSGIQTAITIPNKDGRFEFINANFTGRTGTQRMYGCDGKNRPFEFDGAVFVPLQPISISIYPLHLAEHQNHLFFAYKSSLLHSAIGDPYNWDTTAGSGEVAFGDDITGLLVQAGSSSSAAIAVFCRNSSYMLYGTDASTWQTSRVSFNDTTGAYPYTIQKIGGQTFVVDDRGIITLRAAQEYGNFAESTVSSRFKTWLDARKHLIVDSHISRDKQQYRLFCSNGDGAYITITSNEVAMMPVYFPQPVLCSCSYEDSNGQEKIVFGSSEGFVFQLDKGRDHFLSPLSWYMNLMFNASNAMRVLKRYRRITLETSGTDYTQFWMSYSLGYRSAAVSQPEIINIESDHKVPYWDSFDWDSFTWDGQSLQIHSKAVTGISENISIQLSGSDNYSSPIKFSGALLEYSPLRTMR